MLDQWNGNAETILILGIVVFVVLALLGMVLWNSKTDKQVKTLVSIDDTLKHKEIQEPKASEPADAAVEEGPPLETSPPDHGEESPPEPPVETAVGRSGKVYTRDELEKQIRE